MGLNLCLHVCYPPHTEAVVYSSLELANGDDLIQLLDKELVAEPLGVPMVITGQGEKELKFTKTPFGDPLTYVRPKAFEGWASRATLPCNKAAIEYVLNSPLRADCVVVLFWR